MPIVIDDSSQFAVQNYLTVPLGGDQFLISLSGAVFVKKGG
jgi:hypothetical protein